MNPLRIANRWAPLPLLVLPVAYFAFGILIYLAWTNPEHYGEGIRILIPVYVLFSYWMFAVAANQQVLIVTREGLRLRILPFPTGGGGSLTREQIRAVSIRNIRSPRKHGPRRGYYLLVAESMEEELEIAGPYPTHEAAVTVGQTITTLWRQPPNGVSIPLIPGNGDGFRRRHRKRVLIWMVLCILAVLGGGWWETSSHEPWRPPAGMPAGR